MTGSGLCWIVCASYGLGGGPYPAEGEEPDFDLPPLDERENQARLIEWMREQQHTARVTGKNARNLNPLITATETGRRMDFAWWWLHPGGQPAKFSAFNSRADALMSKWRTAFQHRAIAPATWYVEKGTSFALDGEAFGIAAITTTAPSDDGDLLTYSLVTREAVAAAARVQPRMPLVLPRELHDDWLDPGQEGDADLIAAMVAASDEISHAIHAAKKTTPDAQTDDATLF
ncbi:MAG: SOS response-associated peptidase [Pseudonocardia sp.]|nr:SOS response-associated peptidase [Pseudonocardia sp.]